MKSGVFRIFRSVGILHLGVPLDNGVADMVLEVLAYTVQTASYPYDN